MTERKKRRKLTQAERDAIARQRREKYANDPEWRKRVLDTNHRHNAKKAKARKDPVKLFDELLAAKRDQWDLAGLADEPGAQIREDS